MGRLAAALVCVALGGCASAEDGSSDPSLASTPSGSVAASPAYEAGSCPVADEAFCATATDVIDALQAGDTERLFALSRESRLVCAELATEYFPACEHDDVLRGYALSGANFSVEVVDAEAFRGQLEAIVGGDDPSFSDELGDGSVRVIGVGTCGPDIPGRRTYHLAWTAAVAERSAPAERLLGSFELTFEDDWRIALWYLDTLRTWESEQDDPLELAFCEAGRDPWPLAVSSG